jgi:holo-[acyl-carrier protein] synthase
MILGTGLDIVDVARIAELAARHGERFLNRVYTEAELGYCRPKASCSLHLAGRFAAKEAVFKALGTGWSGGVGWKNVEVVPDAAGAPAVKLSGGAQARMEAMGGHRILVSITHTDSVAAATAIIEG